MLLSLNTKYEDMFDLLIKIGILNDTGFPNFTGLHKKIENEPYMALNIDILSPAEADGYRIAMAHNYISNNDVMADPDMEIQIYPRIRAVEVLTYQQSAVGIYQRVYSESGVNVKMKRKLNDFLYLWLKNLVGQGFRMVE